MPSDYNDTGIATGAIANIQNGADSVPVKSWEIEIEPNLDGKSQIICTQAGKNLLNGDDAIKTANNIRFYYSGGKYYSAGTYTLSISESVSGIYVRNVLTSTTLFTKYNSNFITFTLTEKTLIGFDFHKVGINQDDNIMLEIGNTASTYESYDPTQYTVNLGRTIYGGSVDVVNGTGTETHGTQAFSGSETWTLSGTSFWYTTKSNPNVKASQTITASNCVVIRYSTNGQIICYLSDNVGVVDTSTDMNALFNSNEWFSYELATPEDFTFTPISPTPETALGVNNFYGDTGDSKVKYYKSGYGYTSVTVNQKDSSDTLIDTKTIKLHRLIYEGSVDVIRGIGSDAYKEMTIKEMGFSRTGDYFQVSRSSVGAGALTNDNIFCTCYQRGSSSGDKVFWYTDSYIRFRDSAYTTVEAMESAVGNESFRFLASTPTAFTFQPVSFNTIEGEQTLYSDEGNSAITYRKGVE